MKKLWTRALICSALLWQIQGCTIYKSEGRKKLVSAVPVTNDHVKTKATECKSRPLPEDATLVQSTKDFAIYKSNQTNDVITVSLIANDSPEKQCHFQFSQEFWDQNYNSILDELTTSFGEGESL